MAEISATAVKELREKSGAGMMLCKKALQETKGDLTAAIEYLRKQGEASAGKRAGRVAKEGIIGTMIKDDCAVILELNSETDFVARNDDFRKLHSSLLAALAASKAQDMASFEKVKSPELGNRTVRDSVIEINAKIGEKIEIKRFQIMKTEPDSKIFTYIHMNGKIGVLLKLNAPEAAFANQKVLDMGKDLCMQVAASNPAAIKREEISKDIIEKESAIYREISIKEGKPEKILDKIVQGKLAKFYEENCLLEQPFVKEPEKKVSKLIEEVSREAGAGISVAAFIRYQLGVE